jgi:hypothetical protein
MIQVTEQEMNESMFGSIGPLLICKECEYRDYTPMESDAYNYECECCGENALCSAEELLLRGEVEIK